MITDRANAIWEPLKIAPKFKILQFNAPKSKIREKNCISGSDFALYLAGNHPFFREISDKWA